MAIKEQKVIKSLFSALKRAKQKRFPKARGKVDAPNEKGVYIIYDPKDVVLHVGRTPSGKNGLCQRLKNHLHAQSSFTNSFLKGRGSKLRGGYRYRLLVIKDDRQRALVEQLAIGSLCPKHLGLGSKIDLPIA